MWVKAKLIYMCLRDGVSHSPIQRPLRQWCWTNRLGVPADCPHRVFLMKATALLPAPAAGGRSEGGGVLFYRTMYT